MSSAPQSGANDKSPPGFPHRARKAQAAAGDFWQRVSEGLELSALWAQFRAEARESYGLYSREVDWKAIEQVKGWRRAWKITQAFFWALVMKLSPARRVLLLLSLLLIVMGRFRMSADEVSFVFSLAPYGIAGLLFLLAMELADRVTMKRDLEIAREIQGWLVPDHPPKVDGADIAFATRPANTVAGDYYDAFFRAAAQGQPQKLLLAVADVAGKSVPAALLMATLQASLQALAAANTTLVELVAGLNHYACEHSLGGMRFTTGFFAELEPARRALAFVNAGHNSPIVRRAAGAVERLETGGVPLGIESAAQYQLGSVQLTPGDVLVIFTDGLVEAFNERGEEYGDARLLEALAGAPAASAQDVLQHLLREVDNFVGATRQHDDITCLVLVAR